MLVMRRVAGVAALCVALGLVLLGPDPAFASQSVFWQGVKGSPFHLRVPLSSDVVVGGGADQSMSLKVGESGVIDAEAAGYVSLGVSQPDPRSVEVLSGGDILVADAANRLVAEFSASGALVWSYTAANDSALSAPVYAGRLADGSTLICDSGGDGGAGRVSVVSQSGQKEWQYGTTGVPGSGVDELSAPTSATVLPDGNVAICDAGNHRVIEVRYADYNPSEADDGFNASSIVWQYGRTGVSGDGVDQLESPTSVQCLTAGVSRGNLLICDEAAARVIEVDATDYAATAPNRGFTTRSIIWQYPAAGSQATASSLASPSCALGTNGSDNLVWIADAGSGSVLGVATDSIAGGIKGRPKQHVVFARYGASGGTPFSGSLSAPASLSQASDGSMVVADPGAHRIVVLGTTADAATVQSASLACGLAGRKQFVSIRCTFRSVPMAPITITYRIDGGPQKSLGTKKAKVFGGRSDIKSSSGALTILFPPQTIGTRIIYQVSLTTGSRACAPELTSLAIAYTKSRSTASGKGGGGLSGNRANSNGSASDNRSSAGGGSGSGGGIGGGTGSGSGNGAGSGRGSGSSDNAAGADTGTASQSAAGAKLPAAVSKSGGSAGAATLAVSGYAFAASGKAGGGEGGGVSPASAGLPLASGAGAVIIVVLLLLVGPWAERRRLRLFVNWDAKLLRPFPAERTRDMPRRW